MRKNVFILEVGKCQKKKGNKRKVSNMENKKEKLPSTRIQWYPGHMAKTKRQIIEDLKLIDVVIELLDSRIPISSRNPDIKKIVANKKKIIVLNKSDLSDETINQKWVKELSKEAPTILADSNSGKGIDKVSKEIDKLMEEEVKRQAQRGRINKTIRVMILGIPNVGKSSFINRISKKTTMKVGNKPGVTQTKQWIRIGKNQELLDTPGVLWPKFESPVIGLHLALTGAVKDDVYDRRDALILLLQELQEKYPQELAMFYNITLDPNDTAETLMEKIGTARSCVKAGGVIDLSKVEQLVLYEFKTAKMGRFTLDEP